MAASKQRGEQTALKGFVENFDPFTADDWLRTAADFSEAPISNFNVGAVALGNSGRAYLGANLEFEGFNLSACLHAEQSAVLNAWMQDESAITDLYVSELPCGHCRQFLRELANTSNFQIHAKGSSYDLDALLPHAFGERPKFGLLESKNLSPIKSLESHAAASYVPYSRQAEACRLDCEDGLHYFGRTAESVAYNPSVPSLIAALNQRNISPSRDVKILRCTFFKSREAPNDPLALAQAILGKDSVIEIEDR